MLLSLLTSPVLLGFASSPGEGRESRASGMESVAAGNMCPQEFPYAYRPNNGFDYCCATGEDKWKNPVKNMDPNRQRRSDSCKGDAYHKCPKAPCADFSSGVDKARDAQMADLVAQSADLVAQSALTNALLTQFSVQTNAQISDLGSGIAQLVRSAKQRNFLELLNAKAVGAPAATLKQAGFSLADLKAAGFLTTKADLKAAIARDMSDIEDWDVSVIEDFGFLFSPTSKGSLSTADMGSFNADVSKWNVAQGTNFESMFFSMKAFNADLSLWDVSQGTDFSSMFMNANSFDRDLSKWKAGQATGHMEGWPDAYKHAAESNMFSNAGCTIHNCGCTSCA